MRHAQHLLAAAQGFELLADGLCRAASDADVDLVEDQRSRRGLLLFGLGRALSTLTLSASITRLISPPEAISSSGLRGSPGLVEMRYSTVSQPVEVQ
jgi:hypothetical protein